MRALLDTNVLIHREAATVVRQDIGKLFFWLDKLKYEKCVHPITLQEIAKHRDPRVRSSFNAKLQSYHVLKTIAPVALEVQRFAATDKSTNDQNDTTLVNELFAGRVDVVISEDRGLHDKAMDIGIADRVFTIDAFLEKVTAENPDLVDYKVLSVRRVHFGQVDLHSPFFDSFREDYAGTEFDKWFNRKADESAYVCYEGSALVAFLYLKAEGEDENYGNIELVEGIMTDTIEGLWKRTKHCAGIDRERFFSYFAGREVGHAIAIGLVRRYRRPLDLSSAFGLRPPQSFAYLISKPKRSASPRMNS